MSEAWTLSRTPYGALTTLIMLRIPTRVVTAMAPHILSNGAGIRAEGSEAQGLNVRYFNTTSASRI